MGVEIRLPDTPDWGNPHLVGFEQAQLLCRDATVADVVRHSRGSLAYLATPYTKVASNDDGAFDPAGSLDCALRAARWARLFAVEGVTAVSPVVQAAEMVHADVIDPQLDPMDEPFWARWCRPLLRACDHVIVPPIDGWNRSDGIWLEVCTALRSQRRVYLIKPGSDGGAA